MGRPGHLSHNDEHLPAGGPKVEMQKQMFCFCPFVVYLFRSLFSMCLSPMQASLFVSPIIRMYSSFLRWVPGWRPPPLLCLSLSCSWRQSARSQSCNRVSDLCWRTVERSAAFGIVLFCSREAAWVCKERWRINLFRWIRRGVCELSPSSLWLSMCVFIPCWTPPSLQNNGLSPVTLCAGGLPTLLSIIHPRFPPSPPSPVSPTSIQQQLARSHGVAHLPLPVSCYQCPSSFAPVWHPSNAHTEE